VTRRPAKKAVAKVRKPPPPSALAERKKGKGRVKTEKAVFDPTADAPAKKASPAPAKKAPPPKKTIAKKAPAKKAPAKKAPAKKAPPPKKASPAPKGSDMSKVKKALKDIVGVLNQCMEMLD